MTFFNSSDYLHLAGKVYTRDVVASTQALLDMVQPRSCIDDNGLLRDTCYQPFDAVSSTWTFLRSGVGAPLGTQATVAALPLKRFVRLALLTDAQATQTATESGTCPWPDYLNISADTTQQYQANYSQFQAMRSVYGLNQFVCENFADGAPPGTPDDGATAMQAVDNVHPYKFDSIVVPPLPN